MYMSYSPVQKRVQLQQPFNTNLVQRAYSFILMVLLGREDIFKPPVTLVNIQKASSSCPLGVRCIQVGVSLPGLPED